MDDRLNQLIANPGDWTLRSTLASELYAAGEYPAAAQLLTDAPDLPGGEENVLFCATIVGATNREAAAKIIQHHVHSHGENEAIRELKTQLGLATATGGVPTDSSSTPVAPQKLFPPGTSGSGSAVDQFDQFNEEPVALVALPVEEGIADLEHEPSGERSFIVGEGEAVHAAEKAPDIRERMSAILVAVIVHIVLLLALGVWAVSTPPPQPPQFSVSSAPNNSPTEVESKTMTKTKQKTASAVASSQPVIASTAYSDFAIPDTISNDTNLSMVSMADSDVGFGMSMTGFGDVSNMSAIPAGMRSRCSMSQRMQRLRESGGEDRAERAVREGIQFLATKQNKETGSFGAEYTVGMTGLSLLAFLGHCETPESPKFGDAVVSAAVFLMDRCLKNDGIMTNGKNGGHEAYEHAIATYALSELFTMTKESGKGIPRLESVLKKAAGIIVDAQTKDGGWPYGFKGEGKEDMSVSGWQIQALKALYNTGRNFSGVDRALDKATKKYIPAIQDAEGAFKYNPDSAAGKHSLTGAALLALSVWKGTDSATYKKGFSYLTEKYKNPSPGGDFYAPYYNTQVFFLAEGPAWEDYNKKFQPKLLDAQNKDGSWLKDGGTRTDSQIMNTAWAILMLEVYYRYLPTTDKVSGLEKR